MKDFSKLLCILLFLTSESLFAQKPADSIFTGFEKALRGETLLYYCYTPMAKEALLTRSNTGEMDIEWLTASVPLDFKNDFALFSWIGGNNSGTASGLSHFDLFINGNYSLTIETNKHYEAKGWHFTGVDGVEISFTKKGVDKNNDWSGETLLKVPRSLITPGKPLQLKLVGKKENTLDWMMVYTHVITNRFSLQLLPLLRRSANGDTTRIMKVYGEYINNAGLLTLIQKPGSLSWTFPLQKGYNEFELELPFQNTDHSYFIQSELDGKKLSVDTLKASMLIPIELHLLHHSHTDVGYSHLQEQVAEIHNENLRQAIQLINKTSDYPYESQFRWNLEVLWPIENYLDSSNEEQKKTFAEALKSGRLNLSGLYSNNLTGIMRGEEQLRITDYARELEKKYDIHINSAMVTDIPGYTWTSIRTMQMAGIKYFSVGTNNFDRIGTVLSQWGDKPFYWKVPGSNEKVMTLISGSSYAYFHPTAGARDPITLKARILEYVEQVQKEKYPYHYVALRYNIYSDNAPLDPLISDYVKEWNSRYIYPKLVLSTPQLVMGMIEKEYGSQLPVVEGDMTPYWDDGATSSAAELALNRQVGDRLLQTEKLYALLKPELYPIQEIYDAWKNVILFDEHTWGAWSSISDPDSYFSLKQWEFKKQYVTRADSLENIIRTRLLLNYKTGGNTYQIINTHSWDVQAVVSMDSIPKDLTVVNSKGNVPEQQTLQDGTRLVYLPSVPALQSETVIVKKVTTKYGTGKSALITDNVIENENVKLVINKSNGSINSFIWKKNKEDIVQANTWGLNQYLYVPGRDPKAAQSAVVKKISFVENGPLVTMIEVFCDAPGANSLLIIYCLNNKTGELRITNKLDKKKIREKESVHFAFPFNINDGKVLADNGYLPYNPFFDLAPAANKDFSYTGKWTDISNTNYGVTFNSPDAPIIEWTELNNEVIYPGKSVKTWKEEITPSQTIFSYAANNYWHTNYKADQEGLIIWHYVISPHDKDKPADAYKRGEEVIHAPIIVNHQKQLISSPWVTLNNDQVVISACMPAKDGRGIVIRLYNPTFEPQTVLLKSKKGNIYESNLNEKTGKLIDSTFVLHPLEIKTYRIGK